MDIKRIKINTDSLLSDADRVEEQIQSVENMIDTLLRDHQALDAMWDGPASEVYRIVFLGDVEMLRQYVAQLKKINAYEREAGKKYECCEAEVENLVSSVN